MKRELHVAAQVRFEAPVNMWETRVDLPTGELYYVHRVSVLHAIVSVFVLHSVTIIYPFCLARSI